MSRKNFTCYLIGDDHLLIQCAETLIQNEHSILGIISPLEAAKNFALPHHIPYFHSLKDALTSLTTTEFDYLFSIINSTILPTELLHRPRQLSINFHNAPLPLYAGVHPLSWAILNNESTYGVTWHVMTEVIDGGAILKQARFPIDSQETALSLSLKCYAQALTLFDELIKDLSNQSLVPISQDTSKRSYYNFKQKPEGNGWINWTDSAETIERSVRAFDLGHSHHNRLACAKIRLDTSIYLVKRLHRLTSRSPMKAGTVVCLLPNVWHISTTTSLISVEELISVNGNTCSLSELAEIHQLQVGSIISSPTSKQLTHYHNLSEQYSPSELFWVNRLQDFKPALLPFQPPIPHQDFKGELTKLACNRFSDNQITQWKPYLPPECNFHDILISALLIYLYRLNPSEESGIWLYSAEQNESPEVASFFSQLLPFSLPTNKKESFYTAIEQIHKAWQLFQTKGTFQKDILYRYPELNHLEHLDYSLALFIGTEEQCIRLQNKTNVSVLITLSSDTHEVSWWIQQQLTQTPNLTAMIKNSAKHLYHLLNSLPLSLQHPLTQLPITPVEEYQLLMTKWQTNSTAYPKQKTISQLFEIQSRLTPDTLAVTYGAKSLTYCELNQKSNQLAHYLQKKGLRPNTFAAICSSQELHLIIGILAILKTGAAYIPIDGSYPKKHIHYVLSDSNPTLLLASPHLGEQVKDDCNELNIPIIFFDDVMKNIEQEPIDSLKNIPITSENLAYVMYTSGTTGKPKGVMIPHRGISRLVKNTNYISVTAQDRIAQAASISFDAATFEIWGALLNGATLIAVPHATLLDPSKFALFLEKKEISILWLTSALFNQYAAHNPAIFRHLTYLLVGGEVLNKERIMSVLECAQGAPKYLINGYGPTENTTFTTTYLISAEDKKLETIPIGKPIANTLIYVLDELLQPTPIGAIGELYAGGDGLALGYLNRPDLNTIKFIKNPFSDNDNCQLYKTGDMVRWMPDGSLEYLGRQDNQIKIRGFRVELEAIQTQLLHHPEVSQCCVRAEESPALMKVLVAYIVCNHGVSDKELQDFLTHQLPAYMIPSFFIRLEKMPLTTNGKINYKKLPKPNFDQSLSKAEQIAPSTSIQKSLGILWCQLLGCNRISIKDNFFDLGGHSLLITQLILEIKNNYHCDLPLPVFLENPTIYHLEQLILGHDLPIPQIPHNSNLLTDRLLPPELQITADLPTNNNTQKILLTGASGFLGAHLLYDLYQQTNATIYCLIRAKNDEHAIARLNQTLNKYKLPLQCNERIVPLIGDLASPQLGLTNIQFDTLSQNIDIIFHNGAFVNHLYNYELLRTANVNSTRDIIRLAMHNKTKPIHYISTLSAANHFLDESNHILEDFLKSKEATNPPNDGYSQTKWVSEQLLAEAAERGLLINIYRPGWITGHTLSGAIHAESNHLLMLLKGCIQLQAAPKWDLMLDMLPVDTISNLIVNIALDSNSHNKVFNLVNPNKISWSHLMQYLSQRGYTLSLVEPTQWKEIHLKSIDKDNALYTLYPLYVNNQQGDWMKGLSTISKAYSYNTSNAFDKFCQTAPQINESLLNIYFNYLEQQGFIR